MHRAPKGFQVLPARGVVQSEIFSGLDGTKPFLAVVRWLDETDDFRGFFFGVNAVTTFRFE